MGKKRKDRDRGDTLDDVSGPLSGLASSIPTPSPPPSKKRKISTDDSPAGIATEDDKPVGDKPEAPQVKGKQVQLSEEAKSKKQKLQLLFSALSNTQQDQYEIYRRSTFPKSVIRRMMQTMCGGTVPQNTVIAMAGIAKVYVGEIVEEACRAREAMGEKGEGPLQPKDIREATRRLRKANKVPNSRYRRVLHLK